MIQSLYKQKSRFASLTSLGLILLILTATVPGQQPSAKRPLTHNDYDSWRVIQGQQLSRDGKFLAYALVPEDGDGEIVVRSLASGKEWRAPRGSVPTAPSQTDAAGQPGNFPPVFAGRPFFTADSRYVVFQIQPAKAEAEKARRDKKKPEEMPKNALGVMDVGTGEVARIDKVKSFQVPEEGAGYVAYLREPKQEEKKAEDKKDEKKPESGGAAAAAEKSPSEKGVSEKKKKEKKKEYGSDLVLRNLSDKSERVFADVIDYTISKDGRTLVFAVAAKKEESNGIFAIAPGAAEAPLALLAGRGKYIKPTWDEKQTELVFLSDRDDAAAQQPKLKLYSWDRKAGAAEELVSTTTSGFRPGMVISDKAAISFSLDGGRVFFGVAPAPEPEKDDADDAAAEEKVSVDLWHWKDDFIQPMQKVRAEQEKNRSYRAVCNIKEKKFVQLADPSLPDVNPPNQGEWALGLDDRSYRTMVGYDADYTDVYLVDCADGSRKPVLKRQQFGATVSPSGKYVLFYDRKDWSTVSVAGGKAVNLTKNLGVKFWQENHDSPSEPPPYGAGGWTADDKYVLLYDRFDIWQVAPDGSAAKNLTAGIGRKEQMQLRHVRPDPQEKFIDPAKPLLLRAESEWTRDSGFYRVRIDGGAPEKLLMASKSFSNPAKAKDADVYLLTASTFNEFPDLLISGPDFRDLKKVSDANPQKAQLNWGTSELIRYKNLDGVPLSAMLVKPENFDPKKKYPMLVYIYEQLTQGLHRFVDPRPGTSINPTYYASNGYLVLMPDIVYTVGHPGQSALKCVLPAIQAVVDAGFVDEKAIGIQGHSWGGYQIAYMITQTTRFRAAAAGAPVANMTSAYSGIRWGTGLSRQFQYEHTQSRIGGSLWERPMLYIENSPVFRADQVQTPLLMIHNDADDAVPWYQGIEYFLALRRLGKEVYMFSYNGEPHGLRKRINQKDYTMRLQQFFGYYLKGAPEPEWMEKGIPYLQKDKEKEKYKAAAADIKERPQN